MSLAEPIMVPMTGMHMHGAYDIDSMALVYDESHGHYVLLNVELAKVRVLRRAPLRHRLIWWIRHRLASLTWRNAVLVTSIMFGVVSLGALAAVLATSARPVKQATVPLSSVVPQPAQPVAPAAAPSATQQTASVAVEQAVAAVEPPPKPKLAVAQAPVAKPTTTPRAKEDTAPKPAVAAPPPAKRQGVIDVTAIGVTYSDGVTNTLYKVGSILPNGEKIMDVDIGSSTYVTDKGIRQIRSR